MHTLLTAEEMPAAWHQRTWSKVDAKDIMFSIGA
jgi:hypothetical protein